MTIRKANKIKTLGNLNIAKLIKQPILSTHLVAKPLIKKLNPIHHGFFINKLFNKGTPKSSLKVPYTEKQKALDTLLYSLNSDPSRKHYVPRYKIAVHKISGAQQFKVALTEATEGEGGSLKISLESIPPKELESKLNGALAIKHTLSVALLFTLPSTGVVKRLPFTEIIKTEKGYDATLKINSFNEFSQVHAAISDSEYKCKLDISRLASVAVLQYSESGGHSTGGQKPVLAYVKREATTIRGKKFNRIHLTIKNWNAFSNSLFKSSPELPPCGQNKKASRTWVEIYDNKGKKIYGYCALTKNSNLQKLSFAVRVDKPIPHGCYVALIDRKANKKYRSNLVSLKAAPEKMTAKSGEKFYKVINQSFLQTEPIDFKESAHPYIYRDIGNRDPIAGGFKPFVINWTKDGSEHTYLQEEISPKNFFFLPDDYRLARKTEPFFAPEMNVLLSGEKLEDLKAEITYQLNSFVNFERLIEGKTELAAKSNIPIEEIELRPLILDDDQLNFKLSLPESTGFTQRINSLVTLASIQDVLPPISLESFEELFDNLTKDSNTSSALTGHVEVDLPGIHIAPIAVSVRLTEVDGNMLIVESAKSSNFQVEIENPTPKTLSAQGVVVTIQDGANIFSGSKANLELPLTLEPGEKRSFAIIPSGEIEKPNEAMVGLTWEGMQQHEADGSVSATLGSFSIVSQKMGSGDAVSVINPIESTIIIDGIKGFVNSSDNREVPLVIKNISFPISLASGESVSFDAVASESIGPYTISDMSFLWEGLRSEPDKDKLFDAIVDTSINASYESNIKVSLFIDPISVDSTTRLLKIEFKNTPDGPIIDTLIFDASDMPNEASGNVEKDITIPLPIKDYILGAANSGEYWYRITIIKNTDGNTSSDTIIGSWQKKSGSLEITTSMLPTETIVE